MNIKTSILLVFVSFSSFAISQEYTNIQTGFQQPEKDFYKLLDSKKQNNPFFLNGNIEQVQKTTTYYSKQDNVIDSTTNTYLYKFNDENLLIFCTSNDAFDDRTIESFQA